MRLLPFFLLALGACSVAPARSSDVPPTVTPAPACEAQVSTLCDGSVKRAIGEPTREGAILWAQSGFTTYSADASGLTTIPQLAVYADGTVRRTPVLRNLGYLLTPIHGQILAVLSKAAMERVHAEIAAVPAEAAAAAWSGPGGRVASTDTSLSILEIGQLRSCFVDAAGCEPAQLSTLRKTVDALFAASDAKWRAARQGTVALGAEATVTGPWPLDEALAKDGPVTLPAADFAKISGGGLYRLSNGDFMSVDFATGGTAGNTDAYLTRRSAYVLGDPDLRAELLANQQRYEDSKGEWLGIPLGEDRFPAAKNRELAIDPATSTTPEHVYAFRAIEHLDLRGDGPIDL